ncbi:hypothetical protein ACFOEZ_07130 [Tianweitania populi]|uniref:DUF1127 domain-containing protein n=1 Tax=Tianweitania populi TaxID=1607949 RepID=A0A8J3DXM3_9HYPH|nr:hypothetical protein [Tianweitania populi]GHD10556.1 hypothetical protein GCM10016234_12540 [Tianweitania populi]
MRMFNDVTRFAAMYLAHRARLRTERMLGALPTDIRKDIGWPDSVHERISFQPPVQN